MPLEEEDRRETTDTNDTASGGPGALRVREPGGYTHWGALDCADSHTRNRRAGNGRARDRDGRTGNPDGSSRNRSAGNGQRGAQSYRRHYPCRDRHSRGHASANASCMRARQHDAQEPAAPDAQH